MEAANDSPEANHQPTYRSLRSGVRGVDCGCGRRDARGSGTSPQLRVLPVWVPLRLLLRAGAALLLLAADLLLCAAPGLLLRAGAVFQPDDPAGLESLTQCEERTRSHGVSVTTIIS